jgi:hypothetical protein
MFFSPGKSQQGKLVLISTIKDFSISFVSDLDLTNAIPARALFSSEN